MRIQAQASSFSSKTNPCHIVSAAPGESRISKASSEEAVNGLAWAHSLAGIKSPISNLLVKNTLEGLKRALARPVHKKAPFTIEMIQAIVQDAEHGETVICYSVLPFVFCFLISTNSQWTLYSFPILHA